VTAVSPGERALVIVPTYNERDTIAEVVTRLHRSAGDRVDLLVVDDSSPDGTGALVRRLSADYGFLELLERPAKGGLGGAYRDGFRAALERGYHAVVEMDADLSHDPDDVPLLLAALEGAEVALGSRYVPGGTVVNWSPVRRLLSRGGNRYARAVLGLTVADATSGFRAYRSAWLRSVDLTTVRSEGYSFQVEMMWRARVTGARVVEVPITFTERTRGRSKMSRAIVLEALVRVTRWGVEDRLRRARPRS
jgi:dolichol-phosphate mannosyltransferase